MRSRKKKASLSLAVRKKKMDGMNETRSVTPKSLLAYPRRRAGWLHGGLVAPLHILPPLPLSPVQMGFLMKLGGVSCGGTLSGILRLCAQRFPWRPLPGSVSPFFLRVARAIRVVTAAHFSSAHRISKVASLLTYIVLLNFPGDVIV